MYYTFNTAPNVVPFLKKLLQTNLAQKLLNWTDLVKAD